jgi:F-type H+-transporting ATPase subunit b
MLASPTFWTAVALVIFLGIVFYYGLKPVLSGLDARAERIRNEIREAEQLREEAQRQLAEHKKRQREVQRETEAIIEHAKEEAKRMREQAEKDIAAQLERRERQTQDRIRQAEQQAIQELRDRAVDIATAATAQLLRENLTEKKASDMVDSAIKDLPQRLN